MFSPRRSTKCLTVAHLFISGCPLLEQFSQRLGDNHCLNSPTQASTHRGDADICNNRSRFYFRDRGGFSVGHVQRQACEDKATKDIP